MWSLKKSDLQHFFWTLMVVAAVGIFGALTVLGMSIR